MVISRQGIGHQLHEDLIFNRLKGSHICITRDQNEQEGSGDGRQSVPPHGCGLTTTVISTRSKGLSFPSLRTPRILSTVSSPWLTSPKTVYCQSNEPQSSAQMKNCDPALFGS